MVGDAAGVAGAGVGAEGFLAGMDGVAREKEGDSEDPHTSAGRWARADGAPTLSAGRSISPDEESRAAAGIGTANRAGET